MKSKQEILEEQSQKLGIDWNDNLMLADKDTNSTILDAMDIYSEEHAQSLAKEVIGELEKERPTGTETLYYNMGIDAAIALLKQKFNINQ